MNHTALIDTQFLGAWAGLFHAKLLPHIFFMYICQYVQPVYLALKEEDIDIIVCYYCQHCQWEQTLDYTVYMSIIHVNILSERLGCYPITVA